jgi:hypothetical protein
MSLAIISQWVALAVVLAVGAMLVYVIFEMRQVYGDHQEQFLRVISSVEEFQRLQPQFLSSIRRIESDGHALQDVALQIQTAVADLNAGMSAAIVSAADRQSSLISDFRDYLEQQETAKAVPEDGNSYVRIPKVVLDTDGRLRLALLKNWLAANHLAILRRAGGTNLSSKDLIAGVPDYLQAESELLGHEALLVGTRGESDRITIHLKNGNGSNSHSVRTDLFVAAE